MRIAAQTYRKKHNQADEKHQRDEITGHGLILISAIAACVWSIAFRRAFCLTEQYPRERGTPNNKNYGARCSAFVFIEAVAAAGNASAAVDFDASASRCFLAVTA